MNRELKLPTPEELEKVAKMMGFPNAAALRLADPPSDPVLTAVRERTAELQALWIASQQRHRESDVQGSDVAMSAADIEAESKRNAQYVAATNAIRECAPVVPLLLGLIVNSSVQEILTVLVYDDQKVKDNLAFEVTREIISHEHFELTYYLGGLVTPALMLRAVHALNSTAWRATEYAASRSRAYKEDCKMPPFPELAFSTGSGSLPVHANEAIEVLWPFAFAAYAGNETSFHEDYEQTYLTK